MTALALPATTSSPRFHAVRQLLWHLRARGPLATPMWLTPSEARLFERMTPADQREGFAVVHTLESWGWAGDRNLLVAGLLHDAGKCLASSGAGYRVLVTLLEAFAPPLAAALAARSKAVRALLDHPNAGAALAREAGLPGDVVGLIAGHHREPPDARMEALQEADALH